MLLNGVFATIIAILSIFVALILSNNASLHTTEDINATSAVVRGKTNKFSAKISVTNLATSTRVYDARTLRKGDVLRINNCFGSGCTAVQETTDDVLALRVTKLGTTAAHIWEFVPLQGGAATKLLHRETWTGGVSFLVVRFGPVRPLVEEMFAGFNGEVKQSAEDA